ncbi:136_t:CDS:2 [Entrophospora sp. SA101]|nr:136_t:CDS:2 [Entrophospora sp. SA101]
MSNYKAKGAVRTIKNYTTDLIQRLTGNNSTPTYEYSKFQI